WALKHLKRFYPASFDIHAVTVDLGFKNLNLERIKDLCKELEVEYTIVETDIAKVIFEDRQEDNPCSLCSKMR
ncbi:tRNA 2-thiocytidine(32) synthetase TtcA, partial [Klebsiella oxytoca]